MIHDRPRLNNADAAEAILAAAEKKASGVEIARARIDLSEDDYIDVICVGLFDYIYSLPALHAIDEVNDNEISRGEAIALVMLAYAPAALPEELS